MDPDPNPTSAVNPSPASVEALAGRPDHNAIIMVNLLKSWPDGGRDAYARYGAVAGGTVAARGGSVAYTAGVVGDAASPPASEGALDLAWDQVTLVRYPRRAAYLDMQSDPAYVGAIPDRTRGLAARLLYPFHDPAGDPDDPFRIERAGGGEVFVVRLRQRPAGSISKGGGDPAVVLRLEGDLPMVSDDRWDELTVARYPTLDSVPTEVDQGAPSIVLTTQPSSLGR